MIEPLQAQLVGRYYEIRKDHMDLPIYTADITESMASESMVERAKAGQLTHIMYIKNGCIYVGWWDSKDFQWFFDCYGT